MLLRNLTKRLAHRQLQRQVLPIRPTDMTMVCLYLAIQLILFAWKFWEGFGTLRMISFYWRFTFPLLFFKDSETSAAQPTPASERSWKTEEQKVGVIVVLSWNSSSWYVCFHGLVVAGKCSAEIPIKYSWTMGQDCWRRSRKDEEGMYEEI